MTPARAYAVVGARVESLAFVGPPPPAVVVRRPGTPPPRFTELPTMPAPSTSLRWRAFPPSRRRRMKSWQHADPEVKRRYAPVARHGVAPARLPWRWEDPRYVAAWARVQARRRLAPCPLVVLRGHDVVVTAGAQTVAIVRVYTESPPGPDALALVEALLVRDASIQGLATRRLDARC